MRGMHDRMPLRVQQADDDLGDGRVVFHKQDALWFDSRLGMRGLATKCDVGSHPAQRQIHHKARSRAEPADHLDLPAHGDRQLLADRQT